mmetsp:Transcript_17432/g.23493  ORF Transcript_17432/g.23493 Transcript_17432/m.23493 type:complete len:144 (-) Transcript_17432:1345-1776(-)
MTQEFVTKALIAFAVLYYLAVKVMMQIIFRARMVQKDVALAPYWYPLLGNFVCLAKMAMHEQKSGLGRNPMVLVATEMMRDESGMLPAYYAWNGLSDAGGQLMLTSAEAMDRMFIKYAKSIDKADNVARVLYNFGGSSFVFAK